MMRGVGIPQAEDAEHPSKKCKPPKAEEANHPNENWTLMVGEGGGWAKITKITWHFGKFMVNLYINNGLNGLIAFFRFGLV